MKNKKNKMIGVLNLKSKTIIEDQYQIYIKSNGMKESDLHPEQKKQLRETFFGAFGMFLVILNELADLPDSVAFIPLESIEKEFKSYMAKLMSNIILERNYKKN